MTAVLAGVSLWHDDSFLTVVGEAKKRNRRLFSRRMRFFGSACQSVAFVEKYTTKNSVLGVLPPEAELPRTDRSLNC
jgi:hypothetical protein